MKVEKTDRFADFPQHTYFEQLEDSVLSVTDGSWRYCVEYPEPLEPEFIAFEFVSATKKFSRPGNAVGIATGYGLDGPRIESRWGRDFPHLSRPALGPTQPPV